MPEDTRQAQLEAELRDAEERVAQGEQDIRRLAATVTKLGRLRIVDNTATKALDALHRSQMLFVDERDRLRRALHR